MSIFRSIIPFLTIICFVTVAFAKDQIPLSITFSGAGERIAPVGIAKEFVFSIPQNYAGVVKRIAVDVDISHPNPDDLEIVLKPPQSFSIVLFAKGYALKPGAGRVTYDSSVSNRLENELSTLTGRETLGDWKVLIKDGVEANEGALHYLRLLIDYVPEKSIAGFNLNNSVQSLSLGADGYGAFGNLSVRNKYNLGGIQQVNGIGLQQDSTIYQSSLIVDGIAASALSLFKNNSQDVSPLVQKVSNNKYTSQFSLRDVQADLIQELLPENDEFVFRQQYHFYGSGIGASSLFFHRLINAKMSFPVIDETGIYNYVLSPESTKQQAPPIYILNQVDSYDANTNYVSVDFISKTSSLGYAVGEWFSFVPAFFQLGPEIYKPSKWIPDWNDSDGDGLTDLNAPGDFAICQGRATFISSSQPLNINFTIETRWGVASVNQIRSRYQDLPTPTVTPPPSAPFVVKPLPDIRLIQGENAQSIFNLDDYFDDLDTPRNNLQYWVESTQNLPFAIDENLVVSCDLTGDSPPREFGDSGKATFWVTDGVNSVSSSVAIKISSVRFQAMYAGPPVGWSPSDSQYQAPISLKARLKNDPIQMEKNWFWSPFSDLTSIQSTVQPDSTILLRGMPPAGIRKLSYIVKVDHQVEIPTPTGVPASTSTPLPSSTPSPRPAATPTSSPSPTFTPTRTPTATATRIPTPTYTQAPAPTRTPLPTVTPSPINTLTPTPPRQTPTPAPTPTIHVPCTDQFAVQVGAPISVDAGPVSIDPVQIDGSLALLVGNYLDGSTSVYRVTQSALEPITTIAGQFGLRESIGADVNGDGRVDVISLNTELQTLSVSTGGDSLFNSPVSISLADYALPLENSVSIESNIQALSRADLDGDGSDEIILRIADGILIYRWNGTTLETIQQVQIEGETHVMSVADFDGDGDVDIAIGVRNHQGDESLRIMKNDAGTFMQSVVLPLDVRIKGDSARQILIQDWTNDGLPDISVLTFSDALQIFKNRGSLQFEPLAAPAPFPPGVVESVAVSDFNKDGMLDIAALHQGQQGLSLFLACGEGMTFNGLKEIRLSSSAPALESFMLRAVDLDSDGDLDLVAARSLLDQLIVIRNLAESPGTKP